MLIAQITDLHLGFDPLDPNERNTQRARSAVAELRTLDPAPDLVIVSGDLTDHGDAASYVRVRELLAPLPMPVLPMTGNHDARKPLLAAFPERPAAGGFLQYVVEAHGRRVIALDTLEEGRAGGAFCEARAAWLRERLAEAPDAPTLIALHHPPFAVGIDWMDPEPDAPWIGRLRAVVEGAPQIAGLVCGHLHRSVAGQWAGKTCVIASSVAPQLALDLRATDPARPDGRALIVIEPPAYALHRWTDDGLVSHFARVGPRAPVARFEEGTAAMISSLKNEGPGR